MSGFSEDVVEQATLAWFKALDYEVLHGPDIAPGERDEERALLRGARPRNSTARLQGRLL
jgi:type I restriction enzyme R subunit